MKLWHLFHNRRKEVKSHEAFQPNHEQRERDVAEAAGLASVPRPDGNSAQLDSARNAQSKARASARVFLIRSPRVQLYPLALFFKSRGYRLKQDGRGYVEVIR